MAQTLELSEFGQFISVNTAANTASISGLSLISPLYANSSVGTAGLVLTSNGATGSPYWSAASINTSASYTWANTLTFSANLIISNTSDIVLSTNASIYANGSLGTSGQVLTSNGTTAYWSTVSGGGGGFSNGQSISVANLAITGSLTAANSVGTSGQALISTGTGVQWGALSPGYNYSSQFNGTSQFLYTSTANSAFALGTGDFTIECWFYSTYPFGTTGQGRGTLISNRTAVSGETAYSLYHYNGKIGFSTTSTDIFPSYSITSLSTNTWYHITVTRASGVFKLFINGVLDTTVTPSSVNFSDTSAVYIGCDGSYSTNLYKLTGYISNARIVKGTAVYTSAFTPPTSPLSAISGTSLLTCNAITPSDSSTNNFQITNNGGVTTSAVQSPFTSTTVSIPTASLTAVRQQFVGDGTTTTFSIAGGYTPNAISVFVTGVLYRNGSDVTVTNGSSIVFATAPLSGALIDVIGTVPTTYSSITPVSYSTQFNGSSQYLSAPANTAFQMTGDFTYECWAYLTGIGSGTALIDQWLASTTGVGNLQLWVSNLGVIQFYYDGGSSPIVGPTLSTNTWYHFAAVRTASSIKLYVNGTQVGSTITFAGTVGRSDTTMWIGAQHSSGPTYYVSGYISNLRIVKGVGIYTGNFTVPTSPLTITQSASGAYISAITGTQTSLLTCNGPTIIDSSTNAFTITNNGSAPVSTAIVPTFTNVTITGSTLPYSGSFLVVAGGGSSGNDVGGAGGAGGLLTGTFTIIPNSTYTITVGAGGTGYTGNQGNNGSDSSIYGSIIQVAAGGGGGGYYNGGYASSGNLGGSGGGGGGGYNSGGGGGSYIFGPPKQGNNGGSGTASAYYSSGGGGGAGGAGGSASGLNGGAGGVGLQSSITGTATYYAGGGGGGAGAGGTPGTGGSGGGGAGVARNNGAGVAGSTNTGGGAGGSGNGGGATGNGGSGIVIISYASSTQRATGGTVTNYISGGTTYWVHSFTTSGTFTA